MPANQIDLMDSLRGEVTYLPEENIEESVISPENDAPAVSLVRFTVLVRTVHLAIRYWRVGYFSASRPSRAQVIQRLLRKRIYNMSNFRWCSWRRGIAETIDLAMPRLHESLKLVDATKDGFARTGASLRSALKAAHVRYR